MPHESSRYGKAFKLFLLLVLIAFFFSVGSFFQAVKALVRDDGEGPGDTKPHLTELKIEGPILSATEYLASLRRIEKDSHCKGVLVRIESPGGAVGASQEIFQALQNLKRKGLPVVVSQANIAASGGYYISLAGDRIFTNPGTLTGSIGVIFQFPEAEKLMEKVGVGLRTVKSGALKDVGNIARQATPNELAYLQSVIDDVQEQFIADVLETRPISRDSLLRVADGRVLTGAQALRWHLADTLGGYESAVGFLAAKAGVDGSEPLKQEPPEQKWYENWMKTQAGTSFESLSRLAESWLPQLKPGLYFLMP